MAAGDEYPAHLAQRLVEAVERNMVQRLQHDREVELRVRLRNRFSASEHERESRRRRAGEVGRVLAPVHLECQDRADEAALHQAP